MAKRKIPKTIEKQINDYLSVLKADGLPIEKAILFGSYAKNKQHKWSDIDLCVISPRFKDVWKAMEYLWEKRSIENINHVIEPIGFTLKDMNDDWDPLISEIKKTGIEIPV
jgi:predicted nucleotidyltransferase